MKVLVLLYTEVFDIVIFEAKVNVAGLSARQLQRKIQEKGFTRDTKIQLETLEGIKLRNPNGRWWLKADACDVRMGLRESMKKVWTGDADLGDGALAKLYTNYLDQLSFVRAIASKQRQSIACVKNDLNKLHESLASDIPFLSEGYKSSKVTYETKRKSHNSSEDTVFSLAWDVVAYETLLSTNTELVSKTDQMYQTSVDARPKKIGRFRQDLEKYYKDLYSKRREAASHLLIFMIADEQRNMKPYAVPVRFLPYHSVTDANVRQLRDELRETMKSIGMVPVGFVTDGEWNSLRTRGSNRPTSVIQLLMDAIKEAKVLKYTTIESYLKPQHNRVPAIPVCHHSAVPLADIEILADLMRQSVSFDNAIHVLRRTHFPFSYDPLPWTPGKCESKAECLKSLMATYLFREKVSSYTSQGVNFKEHLYVPEHDDDICEKFHDREDHNHILKRIGTSLRSGGIPNVDLHAFRDALHNPTTGLTYEALTGKRKQSVPDVEKLFSIGVLQFLVNLGNTSSTAKVVEIIHNWHLASDGRGIDEETRSKYNQNMLEWLLDDWMPWHIFQPVRDYSTLDVNRRVKGIQGLTREVIIGLVANIESQEFRRNEVKTRGLPPEHPRSSTTDDVEGLFALMHEVLGPIFDHHAFIAEFPKILNEFNKRLDPNLPFFYWTGSHERYHTGVLPSFNKHSEGGVERLDKVKISRRSDPGVFVAHRAQLPQRGSLTVRASFHAVPQELPPCNILNNTN